MHRFIICAVISFLFSVSNSFAEKLPESFVSSLRNNEDIGSLIYRHDQAAIIASDAAISFPGFLRDIRIRGWITEKRLESIVVTFVGIVESGSLKALYRVTVNKKGAVVGSLEIVKPPAVLSESESKQYKARGLALRSTFQPCSKNYNTVVLPITRDGENAWAVYLLPGTFKNGVLPAGGNYRIEISGDGSEVLDNRSFSNSCIGLKNPSEATALTITHVLDKIPTEIHVFLNFLAEKPLYVLTVENGYMWAIEKGRIRFVEKLERKG